MAEADGEGRVLGLFRFCAAAASAPDRTVAALRTTWQRDRVLCPRGSASGCRLVPRGTATAHPQCKRVKLSTLLTLLSLLLLLTTRSWPQWRNSLSRLQDP